MGAVFEATHLRLDRPVAIKVLRPGLGGRSEYIERFLREAKAASKIGHRNVVEIHDYGEAEGGLVYSVMEFLVGQDLEQLLRAQPEGRLPWGQAHDLLLQIATGLKAAHGGGVIHRDIKPANCFLTDQDGDPVVKLLDFGLAKLDGPEPGEPLTSTSQLLGTPGYMAPELIRAKGPADVRSDIYALGVLAYRMLIGRVPFTSGSVFEVLEMACHEPVPSLREQVPELPPAVEALVLEMLAKAPDDRPSDMTAVRQRLLALDPREPSEGPERLRLSPVDPPLVARAEGDNTLPNEGAATLRISESAPARAPRRVWRWVGVLGLMGAPVVAAIVLPWGSSQEPQVSSATTPSTSLPRGVHRDEVDPTPGADRRRPEPPLASTPGGMPLHEMAGGASVPAEAGGSGEPEAGSSGAEAGGSEKSEAGPSGAEVGGAEKPEAGPSGAETNDSGKPEAPSSGAGRRSTSRTARPPSDATLIGRLRRRIGSRCATALKNQPITVSFVVSVGGQRVGISTNREGAADRCARAQVKGTEFRARDEPTPVEIVVR